MKLVLGAFSPVQLVLGRVVLGATVLVLLCYFQRDRLPSQRRIWFVLAVAAFFHNALPFQLFAIGEQSVDSGITGVLNATTPLWVVLIAPIFGAERRPRGHRALGLAVGLAGILLIFAPWEATGLVSWGAAACLIAAASYGFAFTYEGKYLSNAGVSPVALSGAQMILASGFMLLALPVSGLTPIHLTPGAVIALVVLGAGSTGIAFALNYQLLASEGAVAASIVGYLLPVVSVLLGAIFLRERLDPRVIAGMVVVLAGVALTRLRKLQQAPVRTPAEAAESTSAISTVS